jgi:dihydroflavonol-4-reductase
MTTVVTGASGHVGNNLVRSLLAQGRQVRVLVHRNSQSLESADIERVSGDISDPASLVRAFQAADVVYHLAAKISIEMGDWPALNNVNILGTRNVVSACILCNVRRLVHFSSIDAIEQKPVSIPVNESSPPADSPRHPPYDRSKAAGEKEVRAGIARGLDAVIVNPTAIIGPYDYQPSLQGQMLIAMARRKLPALIQGGFDWVDVRDVVFGAMQAEKLAQRGSKYILGGHWASLTDIAHLVEKTTGAAMPHFLCPLWLAGVGAPFVSAYEHLCGRRPLFTRASIIAINSNRSISHARANTELGYNPRPLEETVSDTLHWFASCGQWPDNSE